MNPGDFEEQLRRQAMRPVPGEWREGILGAAKTAEEAEMGGARSLSARLNAPSPLPGPLPSLRGSGEGEAVGAAKAAREELGISRSVISSQRSEARTGWFAGLNAGLAKIFWPHPAAWAGLAAVWLVISILNRSSADTTEMAARKAPPPAPDLILAMQEQRRTLARLIDTTEPPPVEPPKPTEPRPRGELRAAVEVV